MIRCRRARADDVPALIAFPDDPGIGGLPRGQVRRDFSQQRLRPEWSWLLEDGGRLRGRALWWGRDGSLPSSLDALDVAAGILDPGSAAIEMLSSGHAAFAELGLDRLPGYTMRLPAGWRGDEVAERSATWRRQAAVAVGLTDSLERRQYAWTSAAGLPAESSRVEFRSGQDEEFVELFGRVARETPDVETRRALESMDGSVKPEMTSTSTPVVPVTGTYSPRSRVSTRPLEPSASRQRPTWPTPR